jgi:peptidoglycan/LPS O-acetylase OafA/YrhL
MNRAIYRVYQGLAWIIFVGVVLQFFLAGVGVFKAGSLGPHRAVGNLLIYAAIVLLILAVVSIFTGSLDRWRVGLTVVLVVLLLLQSLPLYDQQGWYPMGIPSDTSRRGT